MDLVRSLEESEECEKRGGASDESPTPLGNQHQEQPEEEDLERETEKQPGRG